MNASARDRGLAGAADMGTWTPEEAAAYEKAHDLVNQLIAAYSARLYDTPAGEQRDRLLTEQRTYIEQRRSLTVFDHDDIRRVLAEYPDLIRQLRGSAG